MQDLLPVAWVCDANLPQVLVLHHIVPLKNKKKERAQESPMNKSVYIRTIYSDLKHRQTPMLQGEY